jgi:TFIIF-interacting CTD phosphatase-like protein
MCTHYSFPERPGWKEFLRNTAAKYEMHVYTMGTRAYAEEVCAAIDPDGLLFGGRILSRDESGSESLHWSYSNAGGDSHTFTRSNTEEPPTIISV